MSDVIDILSGLVTLSGSCSSVYQAVKGFQGTPKIIDDTLLELVDLSGVLESLKKIADNDPESLAGLQNLLAHCTQVCDGFKTLIIECTSNSNRTMPGVRDWANLKLKSDDIAQFKDTLTRYKSTLNIALCGANWLTTTAFSKDLDDFKKVITKTILDLQNDLQKFDNRLMPLVLSGPSISDEEAAEREWIQGEKNNTKECLAFCVKVSENVDEFRRTILEDVAATQGVRPSNVTTLTDFTAKQVTADNLEDVMSLFMRMTTKFERRLQDFEKHESLPHGDRMSSEDTNIRKRNQEAVNGVNQCLNYCTHLFEQVEQAQTTTFEDIVAAEGADQIITSTTEGDVVQARRVNAGIRSRQWLGPLSASVLQQLSQDRVKME